MQNTSRWLLFATAIYLANPLSVTWAGYLQSFSGNSDAETTQGATCIGDYAVLDNTGTPGDTFGTGYSGFDSLSLVDTASSYLYIYEITAVNSEFIGTSILNGNQPNQPIFSGVTSTFQVNLALADNNGAISATNPFGTNSLLFQESAPANLGVTSPHLVSETGLVSGTVSYTSTVFEDTGYSAFSGESTEVFGFTTNTPPVIATPIPSGPSSATFAAPVPIPEPTTLTLLVSALLGISGIHLRRHGVKATVSGKGSMNRQSRIGNRQSWRCL